MSHVAIVGCGVIGATIAYELSQVPELSVTVLDRRSPAQDATGAALGVLLAVVSDKVKGNAWRMRRTSIERYETLVPELEAIVKRKIPFNRQGILLLCAEDVDLADWEKVVNIRHSQGFSLEIWDDAQIRSNCPQISLDKIVAAVYSPQDRQIDPCDLTLALVDAAKLNGVRFEFGVAVSSIESDLGTNCSVCKRIQTINGTIEVDWLVMAAGLGSTPLLGSIASPIDIRPVLGQALHLQLKRSLGSPDFQPVISGNEVSIVPVGGGDYWVGATVEFPIDGPMVVADARRLEALRQEAIAFVPDLAEGAIVRTWSGLRPRPENRPAPIIGYLPGYSNILLATGHYRNGVLLAPATAEAIRDAILGTMPISVG